MSRTKRNRLSRATEAVQEVTATTTTTVPDPCDLPHARTYAGPPCGGRYMWLAVVLTCPHCRGMHQHRTGEAARLLSGRVRRCCPVTGRWYVLAPVQRRREAVRLVA